MLHFISKSKLIQIMVHALFLRGKEGGRSVTCFTIGNKYEKYPRPCFFYIKISSCRFLYTIKFYVVKNSLLVIN